MKNIRLISIGPTCVPAEILKSAGLRFCTYGFDWCRSGFIHLMKFIELPLEEFLLSYAFRPSIALEQICNPDLHPLRTSELKQVSQPYGFAYMYYPHRPLGTDETRDYIRRSFIRLAQALKSAESQNIMILADYTNKEYSTFLDNYQEISSCIRTLFARNSIDSQLCIIRITLHADSFCIRHDIQYLQEGFCTCVNFAIPMEMDDESIRKYIYRYIGRLVSSIYTSQS